jgi:PilZ domain
MQGNRRKFSRRSLNYPAKIIANDGSWNRDCRLVDVSDGGARLVTETPLELPGDFTLALSGKIARRCQLKWIEDCEVGVLFVR